MSTAIKNLRVQGSQASCTDHIRRNKARSIWYGIEAMARVFEKDWRGFLGMMAVSCDESGKLADSSFVVFAGWLGLVPDLNAMSIRWDSLLADKGIEYIKMSEVLGCHGQFLGWRDRKRDRDDLLLALADVGHSYAHSFVAAPMSITDFKALPESHRKLLKNPQYCGFETLTRVMVKSASQLDQKLQIWCDDAEEYSVSCLSLYHRLRMKYSDVRETCVSMSFADDASLPPLQLADVYASCVRQHATRDSTPPDPLVDKLLEVFQRSNSFGGSMTYRDQTGLGSGIVRPIIV